MEQLALWFYQDHSERCLKYNLHVVHVSMLSVASPASQTLLASQRDAWEHRLSRAGSLERL